MPTVHFVKYFDTELSKPQSIQTPYSEASQKASPKADPAYPPIPRKGCRILLGPGLAILWMARGCTKKYEKVVPRGM